ncbi:MAG: glutathione S-transferase [Hyphomicrobiaceae bacterium]
MTLKIWGRATSVNVQKVMWAVDEIGVMRHRIDAGGAFGGLDAEDFIAMNPNRLVPVLDDGGFILFESNAIVRYLASTYGRGGFRPTDRRDIARADQWMEWGQSSLYGDIISTCFMGLIRTAAADRDTRAITAAAMRAGQKLAILDAHLATRPFIGGATLTLADVPAGVLMYRYFTLPIARPSLPNVEGWYARLTERTAYRNNVMIDYENLKVAGA